MSKQIGIKLIPIIFLFGCFHAEQEDPAIQELNFIAVKKRVHELMIHNRLKEAEQHFDSLVYDNKKSYEYYVFGGDLKVQNNNAKAGINFYKNAANLYETEEIYNRLGATYLNFLHDSISYISCVKKLIELNPQKTEYYVAYANHFASLGIYSVAIDYITKGLQFAKDKDIPDIYVMRGRFRFEFGDHLGATTDCDSAIYIDKNHCVAYTERTTFYLDSKRFKESLISASQGLKRGCMPGALFFRRGLSKYKLEDILGAREDIIRAIELKDAEAIEFIKNKSDYKFRLLFPRKYWETL